MNKKKNKFGNGLSRVMQGEAARKALLKWVRGGFKPVQAKQAPIVFRPVKCRTAAFYGDTYSDGPSYHEPAEGRKDFVRKLEKRGFKLLGKGAFSSVLAKEGSKRVIRVTYGNDNWLDYVIWSMKKGYSGTFAPRVYGYKKVVWKDDVFFIASAERLDRTAYHVGAEEDAALIPDLIYKAKYNPLAKTFLELYNPRLAQFYDDFLQEFSKQGLDLHKGNLMLRGNEIVFNDPVSGSCKTEYVRLREPKAPAAIW